MLFATKDSERLKTCTLMYRSQNTKNSSCSNKHKTSVSQNRKITKTDKAACKMELFNAKQARSERLDKVPA